MDNKAKKVFNDKLKGFEAPVPESLWSSIDAGVNGSVPPTTTNLWKWAGLLLLLLTFSGIGYLVYDGTTENGTKNEIETKELETTQNPAELSKSGEDQTVLADSSSHKTNQTPSVNQITNMNQITNNNVVIDSNLDLVEADNFVQPEPEVVSSVMTIEEKETTSTEEFVMLEVKKISGLKFSPPYIDLGVPAFPAPILVDSIPKDIDEVSRPISFKWHAALTFNYLNITPNTQDDVFFDAVSTGVSFSLDRIGIRPGIEMLIPINDKLAIKNDLLLGFRRYKIAIDYISDASQTENTFERLANTYSQVSLGISTGFSYGLITLAQRKIDFDLGLSLEQMISDQIKDELILGSPQRVLSLNIGLSLYPKKPEKMSWIIRPFGFFSLNQKASTAPANLTPFGLGIQLSRNR